MWSFPHFDSSVGLRHSSREDSNGQIAANPQAATVLLASAYMCVDLIKQGNSVRGFGCL